MVMMIIDQCMM